MLPWIKKRVRLRVFLYPIPPDALTTFQALNIWLLGCTSYSLTKIPPGFHLYNLRPLYWGLAGFLIFATNLLPLVRMRISPWPGVRVHSKTVGLALSSAWWAFLTVGLWIGPGSAQAIELILGGITLACMMEARRTVLPYAD